MDTLMIISCKHLDTFLDDYLAGRLGTVTSLRFKAHLAVCSACRKYLDEYRRCVDAAKKVGQQPDGPAEPMPAELAESIARLMAEDSKPGGDAK